ncbi:hypothetical protein [Nonomuraea sp. NPDC049625]|uniref:hypothetical protein n=1 Tax=Nonomuraea sp. NPDC049625 TaxID=3155775 RepID=UPI00342E9D9D
MAVTVTATTIAIESVITGVHHLYGAILEADLFGAHVVLVVLFAGLVTALLLRRHLRRTRDGAPWGFIAFASLFYVGWWGLFEGAYNHTAKQVLHLVGASEESLRRLFPVKFEVPRDAFFEATGMLTFVASLGVAWSLWGMARYREHLCRQAT